MTACSGWSDLPASLPLKSRRMGRAPRPGIRTGDVLLAIGLEPVERPNDVVRTLHRSDGRPPSPLHRAPAERARGTRDRAGAAVARQHRALLRARRRRDLHAAGRRGRAVSPAGRRSNAPFLLAVPRVLRGVHVLVQRPARSARLGVLLGRRGVDPAAAAALPAFHAGLSRAAAELGAQLDRPRDAAAAVRAGRARRSRADRRGRAGADEPGVLHEPGRAPRPLRPALSLGVPRGRPAGAGPRVRPRALGHRAPSAALDRVGHGARRDAVRDRLCRAVGVRVHAVAADGAVGDPAVASCRSPLRRRSCATA